MSSILTVSQINRYIASMIKGEKRLHGILASGEISNFTCHNKTGHLYFTLKDNETSIKAVMFSNMASQLKFAPKSGMNVIVAADVRVYERDGVYQLYVTDMQPDGLGAMYLAFEQLKERLSAEGIFSMEHKKPIPQMPNRIAIVTSLDAAALQDMLKILSRRYPVAEVTIFPALVQGANAPESICRAIMRADRSNPDLIICGRGGGSPEDLAAFNSEAVARSIYACNTPIISAVGHETDTSIADYAADLRAATPSAAAELAVPDISVLYDKINSVEKVLNRAVSAAIGAKLYRLEIISERLEAASPSGKLSALGEKISAAEKALTSAYKIKLQGYGGTVAEKAALLENLSPLKTLSRGYSLVYKGDKLVNSVKDLSEKDKISIRMSDGTMSAIIERKEEAANEI